ncbi:MAG: hypothetical protein GYA36_19030 [Veillonellaceae bacterium]|nr:hypothetical protein [Veillonellaceae bacterium]
MRGYVRVPQFWYYAKTWDELCGPPQGDADAYVKTVGRQTFAIVPLQPPARFGQIVFRVEDDGSLTQVDACYDSSG